jgi:hypothetical protein
MRFRDLYGKLEGTDAPSDAFDTSLTELPVKNRAN